MSSIKFSLLVILSLVSLNTMAATQLTEKSVADILKSMKAAVEAQDVNRLLSHFSKDATIVIDIPAHLGGKVAMSISEYKNVLREGWALPATYIYDTTSETITIHPNGKSATATDVTTETIKMDGKEIMSTRTSQKVSIKLLNGSPIITHLYGTFE